jgi:hypothetical protein
MRKGFAWVRDTLKVSRSPPPPCARRRVHCTLTAPPLRQLQELLQRRMQAYVMAHVDGRSLLSIAREEGVAAGHVSGALVDRVASVVNLDTARGAVVLTERGDIALVVSLQPTRTAKRRCAATVIGAAVVVGAVLLAVSTWLLVERA